MQVSKNSVVLLLFFVFSGIEICTGQIREVHRVLLGDVGAARVDRRGNATVYINPRRCQQLGPELCEYFRNHEYGHINLNHFRRNISVQQAEAEADRYAARISSPAATRAAYNWFSAGNGSSRLHGTSAQRAGRVAGQAQVAFRNSSSRQVRNRTLSAGAPSTIRTQPNQLRRYVTTTRPMPYQRCVPVRIPTRNVR